MSVLRPPARPRRLASLASGAALALSLSALTLVHAQAPGGSALDRKPFGGANRGLFNGTDMNGPAGAPMLQRTFPNLRVAQPTALGPVPGTNKLFVTQQAGSVITFENKADAAQSTTMLDIRSRIGQGGANERGLLNLAFDKDFGTNGFFYVYYTGGQGLNTNFPAFLDRYQVTKETGVADPATRCQVLTVTQPQSNHNGVGMFVDPEGFLYVTFGDGGAANDKGPGHAPEGNGQALNTLLGKLIRIKVDTSNPKACGYNTAGNPFSNAAGNQASQAGRLREIFAFGLRHPYRMTPDRMTGDIWIGDVGQNAREEIDFMSKAEVDRVVRGGSAPNFGWPCREGAIQGPIVTATCDAANERIDPVFDYVEGVGASVIGGFVYRGTALPQLRGKYVYARYGQQAMHMFTPKADGTRATDDVRLFSTATLGGRVWSIGEDAQGELYALFGSSNQISKLVPTGGATDASAMIPARLSDTGLFKDTRALVFAQGVVPYDVNSKLFSDNLEKTRAFAVPDGQRMTFDPKGRFDLPVNSVVLKHFELDGKRIETRVLARTEQVWRGFTYEWLADQSDAMLVPDEGKTIKLANGQMYDLPSRADCQSCHNRGASDRPQQIIGLQARQLNFEFFYPKDDASGGKGVKANQLRALSDAGFFSAPVPADTAPLGVFPQNPPQNLASLTNAQVNLAARSFLESNCAICHREGGGTPTAIDLQFDALNAKTLIFNEVPGEGVVDGAKLVIASKAPDNSVLLKRMLRVVGADADDQGMPPISHRQMDKEGIALITRWINSIDEKGNPLPDR